MNKDWLKYGAIGLVVIVVLYAIMKGTSTQSTTFNTTPVSVEYEVTNDPAANVAARVQGFETLAGVGTGIYNLKGQVATTAIANETQRQISRNDTLLAQFGLDIQRQIEGMRGEQKLREMEFQASQVNYLAESFRDTNIARQSNVLNALTGIWGGRGTGYTYPQSTGGATGILREIGGIVRGVGGFLGF